MQTDSKLRVVLMSATMDAEKVARYIGHQHTSHGYSRQDVSCLGAIFRILLSALDFLLSPRTKPYGMMPSRVLQILWARFN